MKRAERAGRLAAACVLFVASFRSLAAVASAPALMGSPGQTGNSGQQASSATAPYTVSGLVVNGVNGSPIARALVRIGNRAMLTDALGRFSFPEFTGSSGSVQVTRPGYALSPDDPGARAAQTIDLTSRLEMKLYPDAVITGVVTGSDRLPVERAQVTLLRENLEENGPRSLPAGFAQTDSHGVYRFNEPPGRYRLSIAYSQRASVDGTVMLPLDYPESGGTETQPVFTVISNEERRIDLHPRTALAYPVRFRMAESEIRYNPRVTIKSSTGASFSVFARNSRERDVLELSLPSGSYELRAITQAREGRQEADVHVTVAGKPVEGLELHFVPVPAIPVVMTAEAVSGQSSSGSSTATAQPPRLSSFGLRLQSSSRSDQFGGEDAGLATSGQDSAGFEVSPGVYRLRGVPSGQWYIRSATYGGANLLTQPLTVANGAGGEPVRVVVANDMGQITGKVAGVSAGSTPYVYLMAHQPGLSMTVQLQANADGTYTRNLPPGTYTAYAFTRRFPADLQNAEILKRLSQGVEVSVPASGKVSVDLTAQPAELTR